MTRTRSIWLACITAGVLLSLLAVGRAAAFLPDGQKTLPGPDHAWTWQNPTPHGNGLVAVSVVGSHIVTAGGTQAVYSTADVGATWRAFGIDTNQTIPTVILDPESDGQNGWLIYGNDQGGSFQSECWQTGDYGATWTHLSDFAQNVPVDTLFALDSQTLYAGGDGGYVAVSTDAGTTWDDIPIPMDESYTAFVSGIAFVDADRGWAATSRILYGTADGGKTWTRAKEFEQDPQDAFKPRISGVAATLQKGDEQDLINLYMTTGQDGAWQSLGGGEWEKSKIGAVTETYHVSFLNPGYGIITGGAGKVWTTDDAGIEWVAGQLPLEFNVFSAAWDRKSGSIVACGAGGMLANSRDGGLTWNRIGRGFPWTLYGSAFKDQDTGWVVGEAGVVAATDDGSSWRILRSARDSRPALNDVAFPTYSRGCAVGAKGTILTTVNGGAGWTTRKSGTDADLYGVAFAGKSDGWAVGGRRVNEGTSRAVIRRTTDGGVHWTGQTVPAGVEALNKVRFVDDRTGWAVGGRGVVLRTTDGGATWKKVQLAPKSSLSDVDFVDRKYGWVCGSIALGGDIGYRTTDGGATWVRETITADAVQAVDFIDRKHGWQVGMSGIVLYTADGGASWKELPQSAPSSYLFDIRMWSDGTGYVAGQFGTIMKTESGGQGDQ